MMYCVSEPSGVMDLWYLIIVLGTFVEGEFTILAACAAVLWGDLNLYGVMVSGCLGAWLGDWFFFELGRRKGEAFIHRRAWLRGRLDKVGDFLAMSPILAIFFFRFQLCMRMIASFSLGCSDLKKPRFLYLNLMASALWAFVIGWVCTNFLIFTEDLWAVVQSR